MAEVSLQGHPLQISPVQEVPRNFTGNSTTQEEGDTTNSGASQDPPSLKLGPTWSHYLFEGGGGLRERPATRERMVSPLKHSQPLLLLEPRIAGVRDTMSQKHRRDNPVRSHTPFLCYNPTPTSGTGLPHPLPVPQDPRPATFCRSCRTAFFSRARRSDSCTAWARIWPA